MNEWDYLTRLGIALAVGIAIGFERGWQQRETESGIRSAGVRTFALTALVGGLCGALAHPLGIGIVAVGFVGVLALIVAGYLRPAPGAADDHGLTTEVAQILTYLLGAGALWLEPVLIAAVAVTAILLLSLKAKLHGMLERVRQLELQAAVQLLAISVLVLPWLPNKGYGPGDVLNPYQIWWTVVLIAGLSFAGHVAIRIGGARIGLLLTALLGGLASSTAVTLSFARRGKTQPRLQPELATGVVLANSIMVLRALAIAALINPALLQPLAIPLGAMAVTGFLAAAVLYFGHGDKPPVGELLQTDENPLELWTAIKFAAALAIVALLSYWARDWFGSEGLYGVAAIAGVTDVDAIAVSVARAGIEGAALHITPRVAAIALLIAAFTNTVVKGVIVAMLAGGTMARRVGVAVASMGAAGALAVLLA